MCLLLGYMLLYKNIEHCITMFVWQIYVAGNNRTSVASCTMFHAALEQRNVRCSWTSLDTHQAKEAVVTKMLLYRLSVFASVAGKRCKESDGVNQFSNSKY
jgi:hypothetical protein